MSDDKHVRGRPRRADALREMLSIKCSTPQRELIRWYAARCGISESASIRESALRVALRGLLQDFGPELGPFRDELAVFILAPRPDPHVARDPRPSASTWLSDPARLERLRAALDSLDPSPRPEA